MGLNVDRQTSERRGRGEIERGMDNCLDWSGRGDVALKGRETGLETLLDEPAWPRRRGTLL